MTYQNETASGWQRQPLATPLTLSPGQTYVVSVGLNTVYAKTSNGLAQPDLVAARCAPSPTAPTASSTRTAGQFPTSSWQSSNYFVDGVVSLPAAAAAHAGGDHADADGGCDRRRGRRRAVSATFSAYARPVDA